MRESENAFGDERLALAKAKVIAKELDSERAPAKRRAIVARLLELTEVLPTDAGLRMQTIFLRGRAALELNDAEIGCSAAKGLRALNASVTADDAGLEILARLDLEGWNTDDKPIRHDRLGVEKSPAWCEVVAREADPSVVTDADGRARMAATKLPWKVRDLKTGIVMLLCPPGEFTMGSPESESGREEDEVQARVAITRPFYISETAVTQAQWEEVMGPNPSNFKGAGRPVEQVSWYACQHFCSARGLRLPSEAEWEYACRAGTTEAHAGDPNLLAWFGDNSGDVPINAAKSRGRAEGRGELDGFIRVLRENGCQTHPVKQKTANPWGLFDMHGNVWEWCQDAYAPHAAATQAAAELELSSFRVARGGSWASISNMIRSAYRYHVTPGIAANVIGLRVARDAC